MSRKSTNRKIEEAAQHFQKKNQVMESRSSPKYQIHCRNQLQLVKLCRNVNSLRGGTQVISCIVTLLYNYIILL